MAIDGIRHGDREGLSDTSNTMGFFFKRKSKRVTALKGGALGVSSMSLLKASMAREPTHKTLFRLETEHALGMSTLIPLDLNAGSFIFLSQTFEKTKETL